MLGAILPLVGSILGGLQVLDTMVRADSAPQQAAGMAIACAYAVVPYVFARSLEMMRGPSRPSAGPSAYPLTLQATPTDQATLGAQAPSKRMGGRAWFVGIGIVAVIALLANPSSTARIIRSLTNGQAEVATRLRIDAVLYTTATRSAVACERAAGTELRVVGDHGSWLHVRAGDCEGWLMQESTTIRDTK